MAKNGRTYFDCVAGSQLRDTQGEILDIAGADISILEDGRGRANDNHGVGFYNSIGRITEAKKIFSEADCENERHRYYWNKIKAPYIYAKGYLYDDEDHPNAKAAAAILRNIHREDCPLKIKASVEGGVISRGIRDPKVLTRTKIHSVALTFTPANNNTLVEPLNVEKSSKYRYYDDMLLIKSVMHLAKKDIPSFRSVTRRVSAEQLHKNLSKIKELADELGIEVNIPDCKVDELVKSAVEDKLCRSVLKIHELVKALTAGYGGASAPLDRTGGAVLQTEAIDGLDQGIRGFNFITCYQCGKEQVYFNNQVKCSKCGHPFRFEELYRAIQANK